MGARGGEEKSQEEPPHKKPLSIPHWRKLSINKNNPVKKKNNFMNK